MGSLIQMLTFFSCILFIHLVLDLTLNTSAQPDFLYYNCTYTADYTNSSTYYTNLNIILSYLSSNIDQYGYYNSSIGQEPDRVTAVALCRGDVELELCRACVHDSISKLTQVCSDQKEAIAWYANCMLRYTNQIMSFGTTDWGPGFSKWGDKLFVPDEYMNTFQELQRTSEDFADLSESVCSQCINAFMEQILFCCNGSKGGAVYKPTCNLRYELGTNASYNQSSPPPLPQALPPPSGDNTIQNVIIIVFSIAIFVMMHVFFFLICFWIKRKKLNARYRYGEILQCSLVPIWAGILEPLQYDFSTVRLATDNFSDSKKLGHGGFGPVYKGILPNGKEIAVKRLSKESRQGEEEFKNEVLLMIGLLHRNLVSLLGFSLQGTERLLVSEFVVNGSLDHFIFDTIKGATLDWGKRYNIIGGIAKGLVYLHEDSPHRIIHRDLKASNILLDAEMNAKIADFCMARCFVLDETQGSTTKIAGTYGYMAPEVLQGHISVKSDVYSFGVLVLEIISGQKISKTFVVEENAESLLSYAWKMWWEGTANRIAAPNLIEPTMRNNLGSIHKVMRCAHIGLLCVQENVAKRPTMAAVVLMLSSLSMTLPVPTKPAFLMNSTSSSSSTLKMEMPLPE